MTTLVHARQAPASASAAAAASVAMYAAGVALAVTGTGRIEVEDIVDGAMLLLFPLVGVLLARRDGPRPLLALFAGIGLLTGIGYLAGGWSEHAWPGRSAAGVLATVTFIAGIVLLMNVLPLLFPDGELPSRRWRPVLTTALGLGGLSVLSVLLRPGQVDEDAPELGNNPMGVEVLDGVLGVGELVGGAGAALVALLALASLLVRRRRATGRVRRQVGILGAGVAVLVGLFALDGFLQGLFGSVYGVVAAVVALGAVPVAVGIALLRE